MKRLGSMPGDRRWIWAAVVGLLVYLFVHLFPVAGIFGSTTTEQTMSREEAEARVYEIMERTPVAGTVAGDLRITLDGPWADSPPSERIDIRGIALTHLSDSPATAYLSKYELNEEYDDKWAESFPTDYYLAEMDLGDQGTLQLRLDLTTGRLVGWTHVPAESGRLTAAADGGSSDREEAIDPATLAEWALQFASYWGVDQEAWAWSGKRDEDGGFLYDSRNADIRDARLTLRVQNGHQYSPMMSSLPTWQGSSITYGVELPASFTGYLDRQQDLAVKLSLLGFLVPHLIMLVLAVIYARVLARHTSMKRGIFLALTFLILYSIYSFNTIPALRAQLLEAGADAGNGMVIASLIGNLVSFAGMALLTYAAAVGGDGLWKSMGRTLWPRWQERDYGASVLASMKEGYFLAFILLGVQAIILVALEQTIGAFSASDTTQSLLNMHYSWLLPLIAVCAGISEELQSRFFGIGLFRKWLTGAARGLLRREPSRGATLALTIAAMLPPGLFWALGHVGYAIYPVYTRIIELLIIALLFGWFMLRFGIMTAIFAHISFNAILVGQELLFDDLAGDALGGIASLLMPAVIGIVIWKLHGMRRPADNGKTA